MSTSAQSPASSHSRWIASMIALALLVLASVIETPTCLTKLAFGFPCPGCGLSRATISLLRGDLASVWHFHPLAPAVSPIVVLWLLRPLFDRIGLTRESRSYVKGKGTIGGLLITAMIALYIARLAGHLGGHPDLDSSSRPAFPSSWYGSRP